MAQRKTTKAKSEPKVEGKDQEHVVNDSDYEEHSLPDSVRKNIQQFGQEMMKMAVGQLRDDFQQIAAAGGREAVHMILNGEDMEGLQQNLEIKEHKLLKLKKEKKKLEEDLSSQKEKNDELELLVEQKERQIKLLENETQNIRKLMKGLKKDLSKEQEASKKREDELLSEITDLKGKYNKVKSKLQVKKSASNVAKTKLSDCRGELDRLKGTQSNKKMK